MGNARRYGFMLNPEAVARREQIPSIPPHISYEERRRRANNPLEYRRTVYRQGIWAASMPDAFGRFRESSAEYYRRHPGAVERLVPWLNRELLVLLHDNQPHIAYIMNIITDALSRFDIHSSEFRNLVRPYIGLHTDHFVHELSNFARTNFDLVGYDQAVSYMPSSRGLSNQYIMRAVSPALSTTSSDSSDSDVRVLGQGFEMPRLHSGEPHSLDSHIIDVPGPSSIGQTFRMNSMPDVLTILSTSSSENECEVVGYVKPRHERTPEIIDLSSSDEENANTASASTSNENNQSESVLPKEEDSNLPSTSFSTGENNHVSGNRWTRRRADDIVKAQMYEYLDSSSESNSEETDSDYNPVSNKSRRTGHKSTASKKASSSKSSSTRKLRNSRKQAKSKAASGSGRSSHKQRRDKAASARNQSVSYSCSDADENEGPAQSVASRGTKRYLSKSSDGDSDYMTRSSKKKKRSKKPAKSLRKSKRHCLASKSTTNYDSSCSDDGERSSAGDSSSCCNCESEAEKKNKTSSRRRRKKSNTAVAANTSRAYASYSSEDHTANEEKPSSKSSSSSNGARKRTACQRKNSSLVDYDISDDAGSAGRRSSSESYDSPKNLLSNKGSSRRCSSDEERSSSSNSSCNSEEAASLYTKVKTSCDSSSSKSTRTTSSQLTSTTASTAEATTLTTASTLVATTSTTASTAAATTSTTMTGESFDAATTTASASSSSKSASPIEHSVSSTSSLSKTSRERRRSHHKKRKEIKKQKRSRSFEIHL